MQGCYALGGVQEKNPNNPNNVSAGRIAAAKSGNMTLSGNFAVMDMTPVNTPVPAADGIDGANITAEDAATMQTYYANGWSSDVWEMPEGATRPVLKTLPASAQLGA